MQEEISYKEIKELGFKETREDDPGYEAEYGFPYAIIEKKLTKKLWIDWAKETRTCELLRLKSSKTGAIAKRVPIKNIKQLKEIINFFTD